MMQLLSGPNTVDRVDDLRLVIPAAPGSAFWDDEMGLCVIGDYTTIDDTFGYGPNYFVAQMDGTAGARGKAEHGAILLDMSGDATAYEFNIFNTYFDADLGTAVGDVLGFDKRTGTYEDKRIAKNAGLFSYQAPHVRLNDRLLRIAGPSIYKRALDGSDLDWVLENTLTPTSSLDPIYDYPGVPQVSRTKHDGVVAIIYPAGGVLYYNVNTGVQVSTWVGRIGVNDAAWYSARHDVFVAMTKLSADGFYTDSELRIYANAVLPYSIVGPVAAGLLTNGQVTQVHVRLLGEQNEPCVNELVEWSITAGDGALTVAQSVTDADGYAYTSYVAPVYAGVDPTIQAEVEF